MKTTLLHRVFRYPIKFLGSLAATLSFWVMQTTQAQIVPNGSFENHSCNGTSIGCVNSWTSATTLGSPDYYCRAGGTVPVNSTYQETNPSGQQGYVGVLTGKFSSGTNPSYWEYIQAHLTKALVKNKCYKVKFYVNWAPSAGNQVFTTLKHIGAYFSSYAISATGFPVLPVTPQVVSDFWLSDSANWMLIEGCLKVPNDSTYRYITIGNFEASPTFTNVGTPVGGNTFRAYYFIEAVSVDSIALKNPAFTHGTPKCGVPLQFTSSDTSGSHYWDFGDGQTSSDKNPTHQYQSGGVYIVKHHVYASSTCNCDTVAIDTIKMTDCCFCKNCGTDLVRNGHFSDTCHAQYSSELWAVGCPNRWTDPNQYTEATDASLCNYNWCGLDHTKSAGSKFLVADGPSEYRPSGSATEAKAWYQKVGKIKEGHHYCFTAYVKNICKSCSDKPSLRLQIIANGTKYVVDAIEDLAYNECCDAGWTKMCGSWTGPAGVDSVELDVLITRGQWGGNDAGIDDISFSESDVKPSADFTADTSICTYASDTFTSVTKSGQHSWNFGDGSSSSAVDPVHRFKTPGTYNVRHIVSNDCGKDTVTKKIHVYDCCCQTCESNLVYNGNFSNPSCFTGYYTDLSLNPCRAIYSHSDSITEDSNAQAIIPSWYGKDHTGVAGSRFLIVDFPWRPGNQRAWYSYVHTTPNRLYCFSMYVKNLLTTSASYMNPTFELHVKGITGPLIKRIESLEFDSGWMKVCGDWVSGPTDTLVELDLVVQPGSVLGFDLGVDDISFAKECLYEPNGGGSGGSNPSLNQEDIKNAGSDPGLSVVPIPVKRGTPLHLAYTSKDLGNANVSLFDETGKLLWHTDQNFVVGENGMDIPTSDFAAGVYYVQVSQGTAKSTRKIVISEL